MDGVGAMHVHNITKFNSLELRLISLPTSYELERDFDEKQKEEHYPTQHKGPYKNEHTPS